jgi:hypothetical protein
MNKHEFKKCTIFSIVVIAITVVNFFVQLTLTKKNDLN